MIPHFIIIGAQKAGTTALARNLALHPEISVFSGVTEFGQKEIEFFNQHWEMGASWYASHFQNTSAMVGEKTAELLHRTICHERLFQTNPQLKLIVLLRSPVERAYSQWKMAALHKRDEPNEFAFVIDRELATRGDNSVREAFYNCLPSRSSCWREGYVLKGMYAEQLRSLWSWFPKNQVFIGISEQIRKDPARVYARILAFLGVPYCELDFQEHFVGPASPPMSSKIRSLLRDTYRIPNERLFSMLGGEPPEWQ